MLRFAGLAIRQGDGREWIAAGFQFGVAACVIQKLGDAESQPGLAAPLSKAESRRPPFGAVVAPDAHEIGRSLR